MYLICLAKVFGLKLALPITLYLFSFNKYFIEAAVENNNESCIPIIPLFFNTLSDKNASVTACPIV